MADKGNGLYGLIIVVLGLMAIIAGVFSMTEPMGQRIDFLQKELLAFARHQQSDNVREHEDGAKLAKLAEKFAAVESKFGALEKLIALRRVRAKDEHDAIIKEMGLREKAIMHRLCEVEGME